METFIVTLEVWDDDGHMDDDSVRGAVHEAMTRGGFGFPVAFEIQVNTRQERLERARQKAQAMVAGLFPGDTGINFANELADKILAAADGTES